MKRDRGYVMNRLERYKYTNGFEYNYLTFVKILNAEGIEEFFATGNVAMKIVKNLLKGQEIEYTYKEGGLVIFGKKNKR